MSRIGPIIGFTALAAAPVAAQVPAGPPYRAGIHPNPIVTFVTDDAFLPTTYGDARETAGIDLMGLSSEEGVRESVSIAGGFVDEIEILGRSTDVLFHPVVRQTFRLIDDEILVLYSFRDPRPTEIPSDELAAILDLHAFATEEDPDEARFGDGPRPERLAFRGSPGLVFDETESSGGLTLFWREGRAAHVAAGRVSRERLFRVLRDLL